MTYEEIEAIRAKLGLTRQGFAHILGVSLSNYYSWSRSGKKVKCSTRILLGPLQVDTWNIYNGIINLPGFKKGEVKI